jgi:hypothetical protein
MSFDKRYLAFPDVMCGVDRNKLKCDACEYVKHMRTSYVSKGAQKHIPIHASAFRCMDMSNSVYE